MSRARSTVTFAPILVIGAFAALAVALAFRLIPDDFPDTTTGRLVLFAAAAATGPVFVPAVRWLGRRLGRQHDRNATVATVGALTFDALATGFAPQLYGHSGAASTVVLSSIVFGAISIIVCEHFFFSSPASATKV